jgi:predicted TIM-barrel fold metal-dependent hydrolase
VLPDDTKVISVDDHVIEPPHLWSTYLPANMRAEGPHVVEDPGTGDQSWVWEDRQYPVELMGSPKTRIFHGNGDEVRTHRFDGVVPGCYDPIARVQAMDEDGITAQLNFPTFPRFAGTLFLEGNDKELAKHCVRAYNDWMLDEWCAAAPERFIPMTLVPLWDPEAAVAEIQRCAAKGARSISFPENPSPLGLPSFWTNYWDPVFAAAADAEMVLSMHIGTSGSLPTPSPESTEVVSISLCGVNSMLACADLILSGALQKFPTLKIAFSEGGTGWVPYILERMQYTWERSRLGVDKSISPRELFDRQIWTCFISDDIGLANRYEIGIDKIMFETDYPHNDSNWPDSRKLFAKALTDVPDDEARKIAELNARKLYRF